MPRLSDSMEEGTILTWLVAAGDHVDEGQPLAEIETDKANVTYEADMSGVILALTVGDGATVPVGSPIAVIGQPGEDPAAIDSGQRSSAGGVSSRAHTIGAAEPVGAGELVGAAESRGDRAVPSRGPAHPPAPAAQRPPRLPAGSRPSWTSTSLRSRDPDRKAA